MNMDDLAMDEGDQLAEPYSGSKSNLGWTFIVRPTV